VNQKKVTTATIAVARRAVMSRILDLGQRLLVGANYSIKYNYVAAVFAAVQIKVGS